MKIKSSIKFSLIKLKGAEDNLRIRMRTTYDGNRINIPLSCRISLEKWDEDNEAALPKYEEDGSMIFQLEVVINQELQREFFGYVDTIKILSPQSLVDFMAWKFKLAKEKYSRIVE